MPSDGNLDAWSGGLSLLVDRFTKQDRDALWISQHKVGLLEKVLRNAAPPAPFLPLSGGLKWTPDLGHIGARVASRRIRTSALEAGFVHLFRMSTPLSTLLLLNARKPTQTLLTRPLRECQLISAYANSAHQMQADQLTLNQQVPGSSPGRRTNICKRSVVTCRNNSGC